MIILRLIFIFFILCLAMTLLLVGALWLKVRRHLGNPFTREQGNGAGLYSTVHGQEKIIEGEYKVIDE